MAILQQLSGQQRTPPLFIVRVSRDKSHYKELNDEANWDDLKCSTLATVVAHGYEAVMDPTYVPKGQDELNLFEESKILCMLSLLGCCVLLWDNILYG